MLISDGAEEIYTFLSSKATGQNLTKQDIETSYLSFKEDRLATLVFLQKYALKDKSGNIYELTLDQAKKRWAQAIFSIDCKWKHEKSVEYFEELYTYMLPGGRQMAGLGNNFTKNITLNNCYTHQIQEDSLEGIFEAAFSIAKTFAWAGGQGLDLSTLRPRNMIVSNAARTTTGALSFGTMFSDITGIIAQEGRRGALILTLDVNHPSIKEFILSKSKDNNSIRYANISVKITDDFMRAVEDNKDISLRFKTIHEELKEQISAKELWYLLVTCATKRGEPGVLFWDTIKRLSSSEIYPGHEIIGVNPCGEQPLPSFGCCCISSLILPSFVSDSFTSKATFNWTLFQEMIGRGIRHLDNVIELGITKHPLSEQALVAQKERRIGLGVTGVADTLAMLNMEYGSEQSLAFLDTLFRYKVKYDYHSSIDLAIERGSFPIWKKEHYDQGFPATLPETIKERGTCFGQRNIAVNTVAPSGSLSIVAGNCSSGIEPIFDRKLTRVVELGAKRKQFDVYHPAILEAARIKGISLEEAGKLFQTAYEIDYDKRIQVQAIIQKYTDSGISSTINLPQGTTPDTVAKIYNLAWKSGLKGVTVYVNKSREGVLLTKEEKTKVSGMDTAVHKFVTEGGDKFYIHISYKNGDIKNPYQIFITNYKVTDNDRFTKLINDLKKALSTSSIEQSKIDVQLQRSQTSLNKITRLISLALKYGHIDSIVSVLEQHAYAGSLATRLRYILLPSSSYKLHSCPSCKKESLTEEGGCIVCKECGFSECS